MPGGEMQIVGAGQENLLLNGDPTMSFFKCGYKHYTNFAMQKYRIDFEGAKTLRLTEPSKMIFKMKRHADLLMDCYVSIELPDIWSPILPPQQSASTTSSTTEGGDEWASYDFKWIDNVGAKMIEKVEIVCGVYTLQEFSGDYLLAATQRDFSAEKRALFDEMTGHVPEVVDPANSNARVNAYPSAFYDEADGAAGPQPSIHRRTLMIPMNNWFGLNSQQAFPMVACQQAELEIRITFRPINQLFQIRDVLDYANQYPYVAPNFNQWHMQMYRFLQPPPDVGLQAEAYGNQQNLWNTNVHLNCTYAFLGDDERRLLANNPQTYIVKQPHQTTFYNVTGAQKVKIDSVNLASNWLFYFQRSDANKRNEWSNYTNWPYNYMPLNVVAAPTKGTYTVYRTSSTGDIVPVTIGPGVNPSGRPTGLFINQTYTPQNEKLILTDMAIMLNGEYRESPQPAPVYDLVEKYVRTSGNAPPGLYLYNWNLHANNADLQPSGCINLSRFLRIELEIKTIIPPMNPNAQSLTICDPETQEVIGVNKPYWRVYDYNFDLHFFEERVNWLKFESGLCGMALQN
jgi:hypothetical protein